MVVCSWYSHKPYLYLGQSSLLWASMHDYVEVVEMLLSASAQVDLQDGVG